MTAAPISDRASALHRRAMDGVAEAPVEGGRPGPARTSAPPHAPALPGAGVLAIGLIGLGLGLAATAVVIGRGWDPGAVAVGPWVTHPKIGTTAIDPYAQADLARSGTVPMSASEGLAFAAATDDTGYRLVRSCTYALSGSVPARFWTITATDREGHTIDGAGQRSAFTSTDVIRDAAGRFTIEVGPRARPGNWLALSGDGPLTLTLRLYDTPLTGDVAEIAGAALPAIAQGILRRRRISQRGIVAALTLLAILLVAGVVHVASLLIVPRVAPDDAFARLAAVAPEGSVSVLPRGGSPGAALPDRDPSLATAVCRYDLDRGPLRVSAPLGDEAFVALTLHGRSGVAFYGLTDRAANEGRLELVVMTARQLEDAQAKDAADKPVRDVRVVAPQRRGFVLFDVLPRIGGDAEARRSLASMSCRVEHPT